MNWSAFSGGFGPGGRWWVGGTYRPAFQPPWGVHSHVTPLLLARLTRSQMSDLVRKAARERDLEEAWVGEIVRRADGVPLFVEELTKTVLASDLLVVSYKNRMASLAADSGRLLWFKEISSSTGVAVDRINLALTDKDGNLWMLDRRNGAESWKSDQLRNRGLTRPVFFGGFVVVGDMDGYLHWIDIDSGEFAAREKVGGKGFTGAPLVVGDTLYVYTRKGELAAYRAGAAL